MIAVAFKPVDIGQELPIFTIAFVAFWLIWSFINVWRILKIKRRQRPSETIRLFREWSENGTAISNWLKDHYNELNLDKEATIYHP